MKYLLITVSDETSEKTLEYVAKYVSERVHEVKNTEILHEYKCGYCGVASVVHVMDNDSGYFYCPACGGL